MVITNWSMVANYFECFSVYDVNGDSTDMDNGNPYNNYSLSNHFGNPSAVAHWKTPGTDVTTGTGELDLSNSYATDGSFAKPVVSSALIDRVTSPRVAYDVYGNARGATTDVGAVEYV